MRIGVVCVIKEPWGGSEELWAAMAHEAIAQGHEVIVSAYDCNGVHPKMQALINKGVKLIYRRGFVKPGLPVWKRILTKARIIFLNRIFNPFNRFFNRKLDLILYVGTDTSLLEDKPLIYLIQKKQTPFYINVQLASGFRQVMSQLNVDFLSDSFQLTRKIFFVSTQNREAIQRHYAINLAQAIIVRNPVNLSTTELVPYPQNDTLQFAMVGNLILAHKGQDVVFDILRQPEWLPRNWHLNIYGKGMDEIFLRKLSLHYGIESRITFHGRVNDIRDVWAINNILLMPSIMEGMALAVVEAMLCARTVVTTDVGGHCEWITNNEDGFFSEAATVKSFSNVLDVAWSKKEEWKLMGEKARKKALTMHDPTPGQTLLKLLI